MLRVEDLSIWFEDRGTLEKVVKGISFSMDSGEILGIVGESGSGKTMTALTIAGILKKNARIESGKIAFEGKELLSLTGKELRDIQGKEISMIFQEPMTALNPTLRIGRQVEETLLLHEKMSRKERKERAFQALRDVELKDIESVYKKYPHELSGGMRQRVMIAAAVIDRPKLLIADEPTTALDVHTQEGILTLLKKLNKKYKMGILFISHNLRVVKELCSRVLVMKEGEIVEEGTAEAIFADPKTAYTRELIEAIPSRTKGSMYYDLLKEKAGEMHEG
ncbi:ABC transporter ATP-binding protein [Faecalicatena acetigenes]|uniref:ABC transporter ATP-binding protein n=1 Tax=Faecalicatena acetigenes TaxID=2981790 RepID=A0ABT2TCH0_9FIRM|nr:MULTISPECIES: ABC transporter ATP-binding protein [Lachnospiraceae]MCU6747974.1 ABC transporter ATP-binding protein [Faecalicatena acetigenes]SCI19149.1 Glutathione import ATP-binding protein GsiA [uncultured Clostridium sp.]